MNPRVSRDEIDGFARITLDNGQLAVSVIPRLGGKISSLRDGRSGREWLWRPANFRGYFVNRPGDAFEDSTLAGWDECLPTVAPCPWEGRELPDHGEVWSSACEVDEMALRHGELALALDLPRSAFRFERRLTLEDASLTLHYRLTNLSGTTRRYLWAMHPLFALQPGDRLALPSALHARLPAWAEALELRDGGCAKAFATVSGPVQVSLENPGRNERLTLAWDGAESPVFGLWLTRGGWHGHHHLALEPTNGRHDRLSDAVADGAAGELAPGATREWTVTLRLSPHHP